MLTEINTNRHASFIRRRIKLESSHRILFNWKYKSYKYIHSIHPYIKHLNIFTN